MLNINSQKEVLLKQIANSLISITIPTYNRANFLDACLEYHIPLAQKYNVKIFISDNASTDNTEEIVKKRIKEYSLISYSKNKENIGPDAGFEKALKLADTEYVWLLGDTYKIPVNGLDYLGNLLSSQTAIYNLIVFNSGGRVKDILSQDYINPNKLLSDIGWHMTCISTLVYRVEILKEFDFIRYLNTNFIQTGIIFEYLSNHNFLVHWIGDFSVETIYLEGLKKTSWEDYVFEIWVERWPNFIFSLPPIFLLSSKMKACMDHGIKSKLFSMKNLLVMRFHNRLNFSVYKKYNHIMPLSIHHPRLLILFVSVFPIFVIKFFKLALRK
jgi:abequosyltransferase